MVFFFISFFNLKIIHIIWSLCNSSISRPRCPGALLSNSSGSFDSIGKPFADVTLETESAFNVKCPMFQVFEMYTMFIQTLFTLICCSWSEAAGEDTLVRILRVTTNSLTASNAALAAEGVKLREVPRVRPTAE